MSGPEVPVRHIPAGERALPLREAEVKPPPIAAESCSHGRKVHRAADLDGLDQRAQEDRTAWDRWWRG